MIDAAPASKAVEACEHESSNPAHRSLSLPEPDNLGRLRAAWPVEAYAELAPFSALVG